LELRFFFASFWRFLLILNINGEDRDTKLSQNLEELVQELEINAPHFAVALNYQVIPKSQYNSTVLKEGDKIEIVHAVGGGI
jgi:sulfur carrier protein